MMSTVNGKGKLQPAPRRLAPRRPAPRGVAPHRPVPALQCYLAYGSALLAGAVAWWVLQGRQAADDPFWIGLAVSCTCTVVIWVFSIANGNSSIYDFLAAEDREIQTAKKSNHRSRAVT